VAELVDALASGASGFTAVKVRVLSWAPLPMPELLRWRGPAAIAGFSPASDPFKIGMRQIAAQPEKARLVGKLKAARDRKRATGVKVEGRKSYAEIDAAEHGGEMIALARKLRRKSPKGGRRSLREISAELAKAGFISWSGKPYAPTAIGRMLGEIK
jgi:hypothetical protein